MFYVTVTATGSRLLSFLTASGPMHERVCLYVIYVIAWFLCGCVFFECMPSVLPMLPLLTAQIEYGPMERENPVVWTDLLDYG